MRYMNKDTSDLAWNSAAGYVPVTTANFDKPPYSTDPAWQAVARQLRRPDSKPYPIVTNYQEMMNAIGEELLRPSRTRSRPRRPSARPTAGPRSCSTRRSPGGSSAPGGRCAGDGPQLEDGEERGAGMTDGQRAGAAAAAAGGGAGASPAPAGAHRVHRLGARDRGVARHAGGPRRRRHRARGGGHRRRAPRRRPGCHLLRHLAVVRRRGGGATPGTWSARAPGGAAGDAARRHQDGDAPGAPQPLRRRLRPAGRSSAAWPRSSPSTSTSCWCTIRARTRRWTPSSVRAAPSRPSKRSRPKE